MQVLFKSRHPQATDLRDLTERRVRFVLRSLDEDSDHEHGRRPQGNRKKSWLGNFFD